MREIRGEQILLRKRRKEDAPFFVRWFNTPRIMFQCGFTELTTLADNEPYCNRSGGTERGCASTAVPDLCRRGARSRATITMGLTAILL